MKISSFMTIFLGLVMITGMMSLGMSYTDVFGDPSEKGQEQGQARGCENGTAQNNKHCDGGSEPPVACVGTEGPNGDRDGDLICNIDDICPNDPVGPNGQSSRDADGDGVSNNKDSAVCDASIQ